MKATHRISMRRTALFNQMGAASPKVAKDQARLVSDQSAVQQYMMRMQEDAMQVAAARNKLRQDAITFGVEDFKPTAGAMALRVSKEVQQAPVQKTNTLGQSFL